MYFYFFMTSHVCVSYSHLKKTAVANRLHWSLNFLYNLNWSMDFRSLGSLYYTDTYGVLSSAGFVKHIFMYGDKKKAQIL